MYMYYNSWYSSFLLQKRKTAIQFYEKQLQTNPKYVLRLFYSAYTTLLFGYINKGDIKSALNIKRFEQDLPSFRLY